MATDGDNNNNSNSNNNGDSAAAAAAAAAAAGEYEEDAAGEPAWLQDSWTFYFHDPDDPNWTLESYHRLGDAATVQDMWELHWATRKLVTAGMFFVMREHVFPCWDDKHNIDGSCVSIKLAVDAAAHAWDVLIKRLVGETLLVDAADWAAVNGISISPKRGFCIVKLWMADNCRVNDRTRFRLPDGYHGDVVFRSNRDNMQMDARKASVK